MNYNRPTLRFNQALVVYNSRRWSSISPEDEPFVPGLYNYYYLPGPRPVLDRGLYYHQAWLTQSRTL